MESKKELLLEEIIKDEIIYCFDRGYCSDQSWKAQYKYETRVQAFMKSVDYFNSLTVEEIREHFGDTYDYVFAD